MGRGRGIVRFRPSAVDVVRKDTSAGLNQMTYQQIKMLSYLAQGYGNEGIGSNPGISNRTVE